MMLRGTDHADRMQHCDLGGGGDVWFVYDAAGNRVRKVQVNTSGSTVRERVYLGAWEVWREHSGAPLTIEHERQTLHVGDDRGKLALVETLTIEDGDLVATRVSIQRHQHRNHLGSASLELDEDAAVISYEEFHPFGTSSYAANDSGIEASAKRYRYIGRERDEETGLYHLGARYYASWLGRWTAPDPIGIADSMNRYAYARGNAVTLRDVGGHRTESPPLSPEENARLSDVSLESFGIKPGEKPKPKAERTAKEPDRANNRPYAHDKLGETNLERARAGHQKRLGAQYDANKKVAGEVRNRDGGAAGVLVEVGAGFTPAGLAADAISFDRALDDYDAGKIGIVMLGVAALGFVPVIGDAAKQFARYGDELAGFARRAGGVPGTSISNDLPGGGGSGAGSTAGSGMGVVSGRLAGITPIPEGTSLALGLYRGGGLDEFANSHDAVSVLQAWDKGYHRIAIADPDVFRSHFGDFVETFLDNGGRIKFDLTDLDPGVSGMTTWELRSILKNTEWTAGTDFFKNGELLEGAALEEAIKTWRPK